MPVTTKQAVTPQIVFYSIWSNKIWTFDQGVRVDFSKLAEARAYALERGKPIKIRFPSAVK